MAERFRSMVPGLWVLLLLGLCAPRLVGAQVRERNSAEGERQRQPRRAPAAPPADAAGTLQQGESSVPTAADTVVVGTVRSLPTPQYSRVAVDLTNATRFETHRLEGDDGKGLPPRIYVDIFGARLDPAIREPIKVESGPLRQIRVGQFTPDTVRIVLDVDRFRPYKTFLLTDPYRLVIDIQAQGAPAASRSVVAKTAVRAKTTEPAPAKRPAGIRKIVLDPGHGGKDPGAIGVHGVAEKDIVLSVAKKLAAKLRKQMGVEVVLTRKDDRFLSLEERTAIANAENADLFISLHTNASPNREARGLETYYLDTTDDEASRRLAARENGTSLKEVTDLQFILSDMIQSLKLEDSITLAHRLHGAMVEGMSRKIRVKDLGVKKALFYVLVGARMPSVLVEMFFITHREEGRAMIQDSYQETIAEALYEGIQKYNESAMAMKTL